MASGIILDAEAEATEISVMLGEMFSHYCSCMDGVFKGLKESYKLSKLAYPPSCFLTWTLTRRLMTPPTCMMKTGVHDVMSRGTRRC